MFSDGRVTIRQTGAPLHAKTEMDRCGNGLASVTSTVTVNCTVQSTVYDYTSMILGFASGSSSDPAFDQQEMAGDQQNCLEFASLLIVIEQVFLLEVSIRSRRPGLTINLGR
jgi:hypothetical protein